ncbi:MAG: DUF2127 domain-containing protein [Acidobacteriota bacterium]|nr:DUF2127 domain-containing protein [Acidobacteriota bacterium]
MKVGKQRTRRRTPIPQAIDTHHTAGLRTVAVFETVKGLLVLLVEFGLLSLLHKDVALVAERVVRLFHMNPDHRFSHVILEAAYRMTDAKLWALAAGAAAYSTVRFVEAYGLWHRRVWAEWFALLSGCLYLPWEVYELVDHPTPIRWAVLTGNLIIVLYMLKIRLDAYRYGDS